MLTANGAQSKDQATAPADRQASAITIRFSIIIPVLHEGWIINDLLRHLQEIEAAGTCEVIVVDGSDIGDTLAAISCGAARLLSSPPGRARQMNTGARAASGEIIIFLHADTRLPGDALARIDRVMNDPRQMGGAFTLAIDSPRAVYRLIAAVASLRSRLTRIPYGDQVIFMRKEAFLSLGCYPDIPIMEDVALMRSVKKAGGRITIIPRCAATSSRRWEREGVLYTTIRNWLLLIAYYCGTTPEKLARHYTSKRISRDR